jgi:hypothetical protein
MASPQDILTALQNGVVAVNGLTQQMKNVFPQAAGLSTTANIGGLVATSSQPAAYLSVVTSSGGNYKIMLYNP